MNLKILTSLLTVVGLSAGMGVGTFALFSDTETSTGNLFTVGDLDLTLDGAQGAVGTLSASDFAPGDLVTGNLVLRNDGTIRTGDAQGHLVDLDLKAATTVTDDLGNPEDADDGGPSAVPVDRFLVLETLTYGTTDLLPYVGDRDGDGRANTLADLALMGAVTDLADPGDGATLALGVRFSPEATNDLKRDAVDVAFTFLLAQAGTADLS